MPATTRKLTAVMELNRRDQALSSEARLQYEAWASAWYKFHGRKFEVEDINASSLTRDNLSTRAIDYVIGYTGDNPFMNDVAIQAYLTGELTPNQAKGVLNFMAFEGNKARMPTENLRQHGLDKSVEEVRDGTYTVVFGSSDDYSTIRIKTLDELGCKKYSLPQGSKIASFLNGADNTSDFMGFAWVVDRSIRPWKRFSENTRLVEAVKIIFTSDVESRAAMGERYALVSGNCCKCGRKLTVPASIHRGMGPICAEGGWD